MNTVSEMEVVRTIVELREELAAQRRVGRRIGLVPTMGALHQGHLSLIRECRRHADVVVTSVFVNPLQFGPTEDFARYPRDLSGDAAQLENAGSDYCFAPETAEMYPVRSDLTIAAGSLALRWEGEVRPGHFDGVLKVVAKLFGIVSPEVAVFGQKDFQQATLIRSMVSELNFATRVVVAPIVRDSDGLALSSRNAYLTAEQRSIAAAIPAVLASLHEQWTRGERRSSILCSEAAATLRSAGVQSIDYLAVVDAATLEAQQHAEQGNVILLAVRIGATRLLDNAILDGALPFHPFVVNPL